MNFEFKECLTKDGESIEGLFEVVSKNYEDERGNFLETYNKKDFFEAGLTLTFVQDNVSYSKKNVLRGLHYQKIHQQGKLIKVLSGKIYDVVVDIRHGSLTYGKYFGIELSEDDNKQLYIPRGFAHGYYVMSNEAKVLYKCSDFYYPEEETGILWNSKALNIDWDLHRCKKQPVMNERDSSFEEFTL